MPTRSLIVVTSGRLSFTVFSQCDIKIKSVPNLRPLACGGASVTPSNYWTLRSTEGTSRAAKPCKRVVLAGLSRLLRIAKERSDLIKETWNEHFGI